MSEWQPIEKAPKNTIVIAAYKTDGYWHQILAENLKAFTDEAYNDEYTDGFLDYDEDKDTYYMPAGWYEKVKNYDDFSGIYLGFAPTHWIPLPKPPSDV